MTRDEINDRVQELLDERGKLLDESLNATKERNIEIKEWFYSMRKELAELNELSWELTIKGE
ncbi:hypothetical protein [Vagococcus salmoninarum]|uniref:hypothetical protein n=1 Tax=Vagococcus salmoninarum TaxID=2739 RepID=UPI0018806A47|nr:hypothetical protein [Vagococcus salmoninarum]MBE9387861.1 hypothetical protein [Vagococcus salmoninarum]